MNLCKKIKSFFKETPMSSFEKHMEFIMKWEAGYVNDPNDTGGETKYGISKRQYPNLDIANLTKEDASEIYKRDYWDKCRCDEIPEFMRLAVFDTAVNCGVVKAIMLLQEVINEIIDGIIGKKTIKNANRASDPKDFLTRYMTGRILYYTKLKQFERYGKGWIKRSVNLITEEVS